MVNEINKPPTSENAALGERLLTSQRQLREMQEEHSQLMQEMEALRQRATELTRITAQQSTEAQQPQKLAGSQAETVQRQQQFEESIATTMTLSASLTDRIEISPVVEQTGNAVLQTISTCPVPELQPNNTLDDTSVLDAQTIAEATTNDDAEDPEEAAYLNQKLAEIAQLKAQYKRVQNLINTTNLIEGHIASQGSDAPMTCVNSTPPQMETALNMPSSNRESITVDLNTPHSANNDHEELISTMMNMFTDFTSDLRSQADGLRAERERIRALKEELISRKRQS